MVYIYYCMFCFIGLGPIIGFLPTISRQLGYSFTTYGTTMTIISLSSMTWTLFVSVLVDKFSVKKKLFTAVLLGMGISSALFMFVPKLPLDVVVNLKCFSETFLTAAYTDNIPQTSGSKLNVVSHDDGDKIITCEVS